MTTSTETDSKLYHYTGIDGLYGILGVRNRPTRTCEIWATDALFLNDSQELSRPGFDGDIETWRNRGRWQHSVSTRWS